MRSGGMFNNHFIVVMTKLGGFLSCIFCAALYTADCASKRIWKIENRSKI